MLKKSVSLVFFLILIFVGCSNQSAASNKVSASITSKQVSVDKDKSIPFKYAFTGFVSVKDVVNDLPVGIKVFNTQEEWNNFTSTSFPYFDIPLPVYSGGIDFSKDTLIYYSEVDAKADFYSKAVQIDKIIIEKQQLNITTKELDGNLTITANNSENKDGHRYVILATVEKKYIQGIK